MNYSMNPANVYRNQRVLTASPEELTLMLYNGAIRFANEAIQALDKKEWEKSNSANLRVQDIIKEFMCTLDMKYELSKNLFALYDYIEFCLIQGNIKKDREQLVQARTMIEELRDTWAEAMKTAKANRSDRSYA